MPIGFFSRAEMTARRPPLPLLPQCGACGLSRGCRSPKMKVSGSGKRNVLIVGEAPGEEEDAKGEPFVGTVGRFLESELARIGVNMRRDCWLVNAARCRPPRNKLPEKAVDYCRPLTVADVEALRPETVILLGARAVRSVIGWLWKEQVGAAERWVGWEIPGRKINAWVCPTYHPSYVLRSREESETKYQLLLLFFREHLEAAFGLRGRPWEREPDDSKAVRVIHDPGEAAGIIRGLIGQEPIAFDYENDRLKPDHPDASIVCASASNGREAWAWPWHGEAVPASRELLRSGTPLIASNLKHEQRWTKKAFGRGVRNWCWDTMLQAHVIDNRPGITSIKFQAFVLLGADSWDHHVKPFFKAAGRGGNSPNRIREIGMTTLMKYCALDSLYEHQVARKQAELLGMKLGEL